VVTELGLRPLTSYDVETVAAFLRAPHVARWWHDDPDPDAVAERYAPVLSGEDPTAVLIVLADDQPIGLAQWYAWDDYPAERDAYGIPAGTVGIDYLIGRPQDCERGLGTALIAALVRATPARDLWVTPEAGNAPSRRVLEKNGFELMAVQQCLLPDEPWAGPTALYRLERAGPPGARPGTMGA
jgi:aminoglycoside 6'-N-acetyltransferase